MYIDHVIDVRDYCCCVSVCMYSCGKILLDKKYTKDEMYLKNITTDLKEVRRKNGILVALILLKCNEENGKKIKDAIYKSGIKLMY